MSHHIEAIVNQTPISTLPYFGPKHKRKHFSGPTLKPGTIAGNVTADNNFIPGNSASAEPIRRGPTGRKSTDGRMTRVAPSERAVPARR